MRSIAFAYGSAALFSIPLFDLPRTLKRSRGRTALGAGTIRCVPLLLATDTACRSTSSLPMPSCFQLPSQLYVLGPCFFLRRTSIGSSLLRGAHLLRESLPTCLRSGAKARRSRRSYGAGASGVCVCARACVVCVCARACVCVTRWTAGAGPGVRKYVNVVETKRCATGSNGPDSLPAPSHGSTDVDGPLFLLKGRPYWLAWYGRRDSKFLFLSAARRSNDLALMTQATRRALGIKPCSGNGTIGGIGWAAGRWCGSR